VENKEALKPGALIGHLSETIRSSFNEVLADGVVTPGIVVGSILLPGNELFWVKQLAICSAANLV
jgi:hypothetical protein